MKIKNKKIVGFTGLALAGILALSITLPIVLTSCSSSSSSNLTNPSTHSKSFTSMNQDDLSPIALASLSSTDGRNSLSENFVNKLLENWFGTVSNSTLTALYNKWVDDAESSYETTYDDYKSNKGSNWKQIFQKEVLDPVGGTKNDYILDQIYTKLKDKFIELIFEKDYLAINDSGKIVKVEKGSKSLVEKAENINGATAGEKNNFTFSAMSISKNSRTSLDFGIADFLDFLMDEWVFNEFPLPISMSLWKNAANPNTSGLFNSAFFGSDTIGTDGSYNFQWFTPTSKNPTTLTTTDKFNLLMTNLKNGKYVDTETGLINLPTTYTEDSSTTMTIKFSELYSGDISIPFSSAALYKLNNMVFGIEDNNVSTLTADNLNTESIMNNFLVFSTSEIGSNGVFGFPYSTTSDGNEPAFLGSYSGAVGIKDNLNFTDDKLGSFILNRNSFGVHLISIDRISKMKEAAGGSSGSISIEQYQKVCNEIRNTFMYRYATDVIKETSEYDVKNSLMTYLSENFYSIIFKYVTKFIQSGDYKSNNLFAASIVNNTAYLDQPLSKTTSNKFGFAENTNQDYIDTLLSVDETKLYDLINSALLLIKSEAVLSTANNLKSKIYNNSSSYNEIKNPSDWKNYGIAGVMPYTRNETTGNFDSLNNIINYLIPNITSITLKNSEYNPKAINSKSTTTIQSNSTPITQVTNPSEMVAYAKNQYELAIANYINSINLQVNNTKEYVAPPVVVFTNDDYINGSIQANSSASNLNTIAQNFYMQNYLTTQSGFDTSTRKRNASGQFYDFSTNQLKYTSGSSNGSSDWIKEQLQNSINQMYILSNFTSLTNLYSDGDWTNIDDINSIANSIWNNSWNTSQYNFSSSLNANITCYENPSSVNDYYKFLITLEYLLDYDASSDTFTFSNLITFLNDATKNNGKAMVAWMNQSSIKDNPNFGLDEDSAEIASISDVQNKVQENATFEGQPFLLTKVNPYSWYGAPNYYDESVTDLQYTENSNYWYTSPTLVGSSTASSGFVGFQFNRASSLGTTNDVSNEIFDNKTIARAPVSDSSAISYLGSLYQFGTREDIIDYVKTKLSVVSDLKNFYEENILDPGLPINQETKDKINEILDSVSSNTNKVVELTNELVNLLNDPVQIPDNCFIKLDGMPVWNNDGTTLFTTDTNQDALRMQYIVTQFNYNDVQNLLNENNELNTTETGMLGLNPTTFFNCIVKLAMNTESLTETAYNNMFIKIGSVSVYDYRLIDFLDKTYIKNYDEWEDIINL